jgi:hypothetical protein
MIDEAGSVKCFSISVFRDMAQTSGMLTQTKKSLDANPGVTEITSQESSRYYIDIPAFWTKQDLLDLRDYLENAEVGLTPVWIRIHGAEKDTKFSISSLPDLQEWLGKKGV